MAPWQDHLGHWTRSQTCHLHCSARNPHRPQCHSHLVVVCTDPAIPKPHTQKIRAQICSARKSLHNKTGKILTGNVDEHHASSRPWVSSAFWTVRRPFLDALPLSVMGSWTKRWLQTADSMNEALPKNHRKKA